MALVRAQGCHEGQGYFFGLPMSSEAIRARLQQDGKEAPRAAGQLVA
jgi:EAL domain-containing protein (putative c-di-GMP-specific phosphodiesterase class I)